MYCIVLIVCHILAVSRFLVALLNSHPQTLHSIGKLTFKMYTKHSTGLKEKIYISNLPILCVSQVVLYFSITDPASQLSTVPVTSSLFNNTSDTKSLGSSNAPSFVFKDIFGYIPVAELFMYL